ncbi:MAG: hypothetical protein J5613_00515 [Alphaproteobacteria bacterium]|nr:hypothetical protein [Alphaproteobacteria bacterium]
MQWNEATATKRLESLKMADLPVMPINPRTVSVSPDWFQKYKELCRTFVRSLSDSVQELALMNLSREEFMGLLTGREIPDNLSIRFRVPLIWGGELSINNLFMCYTFPLSQNLDRFIIEQSGNDTVWLPNPKRKIYLPIHSTLAGNGGNAVADRLSQMSANISAKGRQ